MSTSLAASVITLPVSLYPPLAVGFFGLGTGYLVYAPYELVHWPPRTESIDHATGVWGLWMPGFLQFLTGMYLFAGLILFETFRTPADYMAALAFTAYGVHWFALGWNRYQRSDPRASIPMTVAFLLISILGIIVFFSVHDNPVGGLFIGLAGVYVGDFFAFMIPDQPKLGRYGEIFTGVFRLGTGFWLMYLTYAVVLNFVLNYGLPL